MRRSVAWVLLALCAGPSRLLAQPDSRRASQREVLRADSVRLAAVLRGDTSVVKRMMLPDWLSISGATGERLSRAAYLVGRQAARLGVDRSRGRP